MKSVVLFSSGLDSTVNLYEARSVGEVVLAITFDYGQRSAVKETHFAAKQCEALCVPHKVMTLPWFSDFTDTSLVNRSALVPMGVDINSPAETSAAAKKVWVPNRNGIFL